MKKASSHSGPKAAPRKQLSQAKSTEDSKRKAQALKGAHDSRMQDKITTAHTTKNPHKPSSAAQKKSASPTIAAKKAVRLKRKEDSANFDGQGQVRLVDDKAWAAELKPASAVKNSIPRDGFLERELITSHRPLASLQDMPSISSEIRPSREIGIGWPLPMQFALAQWQFFSTSIFGFQRLLVRLASNSST